MKVLIVTKASFPYGMAATNRIRSYALGLAANGNDVEVLTIHATEPHNRNPKNQIKGDYHGIRHRYVDSNIRSGSFFRRRFDDLKDYLKSLHLVYKSNCDVVYVFMNSLIKEQFILLTSKLSGKKVVRELCEYPYKKKCIRSAILLKTFRFYDGFVAISHELESYAIKFKRKGASVIKVPILIDNTHPIKEKYEHPRPYIFHGGTLYEHKDAIISTMTAFAKANEILHGRVDFILAGPPSSDLDKLKQIVEKNHLEHNVYFLGQLSHDEIIRYQNGASLCILNKNDNLQNRCGFSTKLGEILYSFTPVITTTVGEAKYWLTDGKSAYITKPGAPKLIADQIIRAFSDEYLLKNIGKEGHRIASENFSCDIQGKRLSFFLNKIVFK